MQRPKKSIAPVIRLANGLNKSFANVPAHLMPMQFSRYPPDNAITFERWYYNNWTHKDERERIYIPIQWTALYCNNGYGNKPIMNTIDAYLKTLDTTKKYYTIVQYDDGILNDLSHLDIKVMAMSTKSDFSLPLLCTPHKFNFNHTSFKKIYTASFVGSYTHSMRANMIQQLKGKDGFYIETRHHDLVEYCKVIAQSKYVLCPRGYGMNSFRIQEAIDFGAIPIYISDEFIFPYNMPTFPFGVCVPVGPDLNFNIIDVINYIEQTGQDQVIKLCIENNRQLFTYAGCKNEILNYLSNEQNTINTGGNTGLQL